MALRREGESFDRMVLQITAGYGNGTSGDSVGEAAAHEFYHLLDVSPHSQDPASLFFRDGGQGQFTFDDFERLFGSRNPNLPGPPPPLKGLKGSRTDYTSRIFSRVMTSNHGGIESRRAAIPVDSTYRWVTEVKK